MESLDLFRGLGRATRRPHQNQLTQQPMPLFRIAPSKLAALLVLLMLAACGGGSSYSRGGGEGNGIYKVGEPYQIGGDWYYPREDYSYDETGIASWYGQDFHGERTAN